MQLSNTIYLTRGILVDTLTWYDGETARCTPMDSGNADRWLRTGWRWVSHEKQGSVVVDKYVREEK